MDSRQEEQAPGDERSAASTRTVDCAVAGLLVLFGAVVMWDSWRIGAGWSDDGPRSGYFPFYIGLFIVVGSIINIWRALQVPPAENESFVLRGQLRLVWSVLWPTAIYLGLIAGVGPIPGLGIYVASMIFIGWFMRRLGKYGWIKIALVGFGVSLFFFIMFELWFKVPLPKGPIEALFGYR